MSRHLLPSVCCLALMCFLWAAPAQGQSAYSTLLDPSVRAAGMGRASNAVFWGGDPDYWGNPALLGYCSYGIRHDWAKTQLIPGLPGQVFFETNRLTFSGLGIGISTAGKWSGLGGLRLDYGPFQAFGSAGEDLGPSRPFEAIESWGFGVSAARFLDQVLPLVGLRIPPLSRWADVAAGHSAKDVDVALVSPDVIRQLGLPPGSGQSRTSSKDRGLLLRLTPYNSMDYAGLIPALDRVVHGRLDLSYGGSEINYNDATMMFGPFGPEPVSSLIRHGFAVHLALDAPAPLHCKLDEHGAGWLSRFLSPILSVAQAWDDEHFATRLTGPDATRREPVISKSGLEISLLNVFTYRHGRIDDPGGSIHGTSSGWGLGFAYRDMAGFRCDRATVPQATDPETGQHFPDLHRKAFSVFVDPIRLLGELYRHNSRP